jgi:hypothetical protein
MTDVDYNALNIDLKKTYNIHSIIKAIFDFKLERVTHEVLKAVAKKVYQHWIKYKKSKKK